MGRELQGKIKAEPFKSPCRGGSRTLGTMYTDWSQTTPPFLLAAKTTTDNQRLVERSPQERGRDWKTALYIGVLENRDLVSYLNSLGERGF